MASILQWVSIVAGFAGATFWFISASGKVPPMVSYYDGAPPSDPFYQAFVNSVHMNQIAAVLTGVSVLALAVATWVEKAHAPGVKQAGDESPSDGRNRTGPPCLMEVASTGHGILGPYKQVSHRWCRT